MIWKERWPNFSPGEVLSPSGEQQWEDDNLLVMPFAMDMLQGFRERLRVPRLVNTDRLHYRGYRTPFENDAIDGAPFSRHVQGIAFDITVPSLPLDHVFHEALAFGFGGVGLYSSNNFVHVDCRYKVNGRAKQWIA